MAAQASGAVQRSVDLGVVLVSLLLAAGGLTWCVRGVASERLVVERAGGTVAMISASAPGGSQLALLEGTLATTSSGCLAAEGPDGRLTVLQLPEGSTLLPDGRGVTVPGHGTVLLGEPISAGGGFGDLGDLADLPEECFVGLGFFSWQA